MQTGRPDGRGLGHIGSNGTARTCTIIALTTPLVELASAQKRDGRDGGRWCVEQYKGVTHAKIIVGAMVSMDGVIQAPARYLRIRPRATSAAAGRCPISIKSLAKSAISSSTRGSTSCSAARPTRFRRPQGDQYRGAGWDGGGGALFQCWSTSAGAYMYRTPDGKTQDLLIARDQSRRTERQAATRT